MKIFTLSARTGVQTVNAGKVVARNGNEYYALSHGESGRGRWELRIPLVVNDFPSPADHGEKFKLVGEYALIPLNKKDPKGNDQFLIAHGKNDDQQLILWNLSPGYRGRATYSVEGSANIIARGEEAQGAAGYMGGADCPLVLVYGPCKLKWHRSGRLYGDSSDWIAVFDGNNWVISPLEVFVAEDAAFNYGNS